MQAQTHMANQSLLLHGARLRYVAELRCANAARLIVAARVMQPDWISQPPAWRGDSGLRPQCGYIGALFCQGNSRIINLMHALGGSLGLAVSEAILAHLLHLLPNAFLPASGVMWEGRELSSKHFELTETMTVKPGRCAM